MVFIIICLQLSSCFRGTRAGVFSFIKCLRGPFVNGKTMLLMDMINLKEVIIAKQTVKFRNKKTPPHFLQLFIVM